MSHPSLQQQQGHYRYDPTQLQQAGPARIFPHTGDDGTLRYILSELRATLSDRGQLSEPWTQVLEQLESGTRTLNETWAQLTTLLVDLEIFQSGLFNFNLPPNEQFNVDFVRLRRSMGQALTAARKAAQTSAPEVQSHQFYQALEKADRPRPKMAEIHERDGGLSDRVFAHQRLMGPNPMSLRRVMDRSELHRWQATRSCRLDNGETIDLEQAAAQNRLFSLEYPFLQFAPADLQVGRYVGSPRALFYQNSAGLEPLLIQLESGGKIASPTGDADDWMRSKLFVQVADITQHELLTHLCFTHLAMEAFAIATPRQLPANHPFYRLLKPHFRFLLAINTRGNAILLGEGAAIDALMAPTRAASLALMNRAYRERTFSEYAYFTDLKDRGVEPEFLPDYPYRDDARLLWEAIAQYVTTYLQRYYEDDRAIQQDAYLQNWAAELGAPLNSRSKTEFAQAPSWVPPDLSSQVGLSIAQLPDFPRVPGFPTVENPGEITTLQQAIAVVTQVIFTCSAQHAAVNFSQFDYFGYTPNAPLAAYTQPDVPATLKELLPSPEQDLGQMELTFALSGVLYSHLGSNDMMRFTDGGDRQALQQFQADLQKIEGTIGDRNQQRFRDLGFDYPYLLPSRIPNSINI
ncbi:MAG: lipoxygenase [Leptolyngbyaceae cyanobacterium CSU_1_3]|nr:lipoxygenase [Leptolyngbyaceae cyanobacterium CSU_1_3]